MEWNEYCELKRMNVSTLKHGLKSMRKLRRAMQNPIEATPAMEFGGQYHSLILEPEVFEETHCVMPDFGKHVDNVDGKGNPSTSAATKWAKSHKAAFLQANDGKEIVTRYNYDRALAMLEAIHDDPYAAAIVNGSKKEVTLLGEICGVEFKCRIDLLQHGLLADIKGTPDASQMAFGRSFANFEYGFQLGVYRELARQNNYKINAVKVIAVESDGDFDCCVFNVPDAVLDAGWLKARGLIQAYKFACDRDEWFGVNRGMRELELFVPNWAMPDDDMDWSSDIPEIDEAVTEAAF